jgi:hypothetical protein
MRYSFMMDSHGGSHHGTVGRRIQSCGEVSRSPNGHEATHCQAHQR